MLRSALPALLVLTLGGCGGGGAFNPLGLFGNDREERVAAVADAPVQVFSASGIPFSYVSEITQLSVEQSTTGSILRATGVTPSQGYYDAELRVRERTETDLVLDFFVLPPERNATSGLQQIVAGAAFSNGELQGIRTITVVAQNNLRSINRR